MKFFVVVTEREGVERPFLELAGHYQKRLAALTALYEQNHLLSDRNLRNSGLS